MRTKIETIERGNKKVCFIGVSHIGTKKYYSKIQNILNNTDGGVVLYEGITGLGDDILLTYRSIAELINIKMQKDELVYDDKWIKSDVNIGQMEFCNNGKIESIERIEKLHEHLHGLDKSQINIISYIFKLLLKVALIVRLLSKNSKSISELRNMNLFIDITKYLTDNDIVYVLYGDGHRKPVAKMLHNIGFKTTSTIALKPLK